MRAPSDLDLLTLWEQGRVRHPIDRSLLLAAWARQGVEVQQLRTLPLGVVNRVLLRFRQACFGSRVEATATCPHCGERLEFALDVADILAGIDDRVPTVSEDAPFRPVTSEDLAAVVHESDLERAAKALAKRCLRIDPAADHDADTFVAEAETQLEALDPSARLELSVLCAACRKSDFVVLDPGTLLWDEIELQARELLVEVDCLARAYGWTEQEILTLPRQRRSAYIALVGA